MIAVQEMLEGFREGTITQKQLLTALCQALKEEFKYNSEGIISIPADDTYNGFVKRQHIEKIIDTFCTKESKR